MVRHQLVPSSKPEHFWLLITSLVSVFDFAIDSFLIWTLIMRMPPAALALVCLYKIGVVVLAKVAGGLSPQQVVIWDWKSCLRKGYLGVRRYLRSQLRRLYFVTRHYLVSRTRRCYFEVRRYLWPKSYSQNRRKRKRIGRLRHFRRTRLPLGLVRRCQR